MTNKELAIALATCEKEKDVIKILKDEGYWDNETCWKPYGGQLNNFSTVGNQQSAADAALVEKVVNSIDAILEKECLLRGISLDSTDAPASMNDAMSSFFGIRDGKLSNITQAERRSMAFDIIVAATGQIRGEENITIVDKGEGQSPDSLPNTIFSIGANNKLRVPFVQGKFNMGGTGALRFCGDNSLQLVITKRCPDLPQDNDASFDEWGVSIVRRESARSGFRSSMFTYLTSPEGKILRFNAESLDIIPVCKDITLQNGEKHNEPWLAPMTYGAYIKLYNYNLTPYKGPAFVDLWRRLNLLIPGLAHPAFIWDCRKYENHGPYTVLTGLNTRLEEDKSNLIEEDFPLSVSFQTKKSRENFDASIYLFKESVDKKTIERMSGNKGVFYVMNGQTHAMINNSFFSNLGLGYLASHLLVLVDCSKISSRSFEDLFMASRDRLVKGGLAKEVEEALKDEIKQKGIMDILKQKQNQRRQNALQNELADDKPMQNVLSNILKKNPVLSTIFSNGSIKNPFNTQQGNEVKAFVGKKHPTFFTINGKKPNAEFCKEKAINHSFRIQLKTDAQNDFFSRQAEQGRIEFYLNGNLDTSIKKGFNLVNGMLTVSLFMPEGVSVGDTLQLNIKIVDDTVLQEFDNPFKIIVGPKETYASGKSGQRRKPTDPSSDGKKSANGGIALPIIKMVAKKEWNSMPFEMNEETALVVMENGKDNDEDHSYDYYLNRDNKYLLAELKGKRNEEESLLIAKYKYAMAIIGMSIVNDYQNNISSHDRNDEEDSQSISNTTERITRIISPVLLPIIQSLGSLQLDEIDQSKYEED